MSWHGAAKGARFLDIAAQAAASRYIFGAEGGVAQNL
jgi:hypothetical protein